MVAMGIGTAISILLITFYKSQMENIGAHVGHRRFSGGILEFVTEWLITLHGYLSAYYVLQHSLPCSG